MMARNNKARGNQYRIGYDRLFSLTVWFRVVELCILQSILQHTEAFVSNSHARYNFRCNAAAELSPLESVTFSTSALLGREEAQSVINTVLMPQDSYGDRIGLGRDAQGIEAGTALDANDPRLAMTYAEFPLTSLDELMDLGLQHLPRLSEKESPITCIDLGSGCGRIGMYLAMTRSGSPDGTESSNNTWNVHGIEISDILHHEAWDIVKRPSKMI